MLTNRAVKEAAKAWDIKTKELKKINRWVSYKIPPERQSVVWTVMLRRLQGSNSSQKKKS